MSAAELFNEANLAFIDEEYEEALELYTKAIESDCTQPEYFLKRCIAYQKVNKFKESINDADMAIKISQGDQKIASKAYLRKGISEFESELFAEAKNDLEVANTLIPNDSVLKVKYIYIYIIVIIKYIHIFKNKSKIKILLKIEY